MTNIFEIAKSFTVKTASKRSMVKLMNQLFRSFLIDQNKKLTIEEKLMVLFDQITLKLKKFTNGHFGSS